MLLSYSKIYSLELNAFWIIITYGKKNQERKYKKRMEQLSRLPQVHLKPIPTICNPSELEGKLIKNRMRHNLTKSVLLEQRYDFLKW